MYTNIQQEENAIKSKKDLKDWPDNGEIIFKNVWLKHLPMSTPIIQNIDFVIKQQEKIAICGKPLSGKSSIYNALLRYLHVKYNFSTFEFMKLILGCIWLMAQFSLIKLIQ